MRSNPGLFFADTPLGLTYHVNGDGPRSRIATGGCISLQEAEKEWWRSVVKRLTQEQARAAAGGEGRVGARAAVPRSRQGAAQVRRGQGGGGARLGPPAPALPARHARPARQARGAAAADAERRRRETGVEHP